MSKECSSQRIQETTFLRRMFEPIEIRHPTNDPIGGSVTKYGRDYSSIATLGCLGVVAVVSTWRQRIREVEIRGYFG